MTQTGRRPPPRHEFRVAGRELAIFGAAFVVICALTFIFGVLVGRELSRTSAPRLPVTAGPGKRDGPPPSPPGAGHEPAAKKEDGDPSEERLTFYRTLTAPTLELPPPPSQPRKVEERIVPHEPAARAPAERRGTSSPGTPAAEAAAPPPSLRPTAPATAGARTTEGARPRRPAGGVASRATAAPPAAAPEPATLPRPWTVQVSSFRSRALAEELRGVLQARGFDAYLVRVSTDEGRIWHRVRVGGYPTRAEAERIAGELRGERNLNPVVTSRTR